MNNKYYTPEIEEFHVGFEYEHLMYHKNLPIWVKEKFHMVDSHFSIVNRVSLHNKTVSVKHLDREDIESLGFKDDVGAGIFFRKRIHTDEEIHLNFDDTILIERCCVMDEHPIEVVFKGKIKNKSVLKQVLKMIGV